MKGTPSKGKQSGKNTHIRCRRCGKHAYHIKKKSCASCGFGSTKQIRRFNWQNKRFFGAFKGKNLAKIPQKSLTGRGNRKKK